MSKEKKSTQRITAYYATDEDYKRMNFCTIGTLYQAETIMARGKEEPNQTCFSRQRDGLFGPEFSITRRFKNVLPSPGKAKKL